MNHTKNPVLVFLPLAAMIAFTVFLGVPWMRRVDLQDRSLAWLSLVNMAIWWAVLWWSLHHLTFRFTSLFRQARPASALTEDATPRFVVLYPTCDDFQWQACYSCCSQDYPADRFRVVICDDSRDPAFVARIDDFHSQFPEVEVLRRSDRRGFKAGNLNAALEKVGGDAGWAIIVDADQHLPQDYVRRFASVVARTQNNVGYVQARQISDHELPVPSTLFQEALGNEIEVFYSYDLPLRATYGFLPMIGHGAALRLTAWREVPFPEVVSEDFAISMEMRNRGWLGAYAAEVQAWESFPPSFGAFLIRFRKFAGGTAELVRRHFLKFLVGPARFTEKIDMTMLFGWYVLMPLIFLNGYLSAYVCHRYWEMRIAALHPALPYVFVVMFMSPLPVLNSVSPNLFHALRQYMWTTAIYGAALPIAAWRFSIHLLLRRRPSFDRTPKEGREPQLTWQLRTAMLALGIATIVLAVRWYSPFTPVLCGLGIAYAGIPLFERLNESSFMGIVARLVVALPAAAYVYALWLMWQWYRV
ncbi:MAG: glycosyltransferase [Phycisphaerae bacterium]|nr:glycosyltransferase [Phycisphaerae bacterium]